MGVEYRLLGMAGVRIDDIDVPLRTPMIRVLVAALLYSHGHFLTPERLAELIWVDRPASARANIRQNASHLRRILIRASSTAKATLESKRGLGYRLKIAPSDLDIVRFTAYTSQGRTLLTAGDAKGAAQALTAGLSLWHGDAGDGLPANSPLRSTLNELNLERAAARGDLLEARLLMGESASLIAELRGTVRHNPLDERSWGQLIRALHRSGDPGGALAAYAAVRQTLKEELGIEPSRTLQDLQVAVLNRDTDT